MALVDCVIDEMSLRNFVFLIILIFFQFVKQITYFNTSTSGDQSLWMHIYSFWIALTEFILGNLRQSSHLLLSVTVCFMFDIRHFWENSLFLKCKIILRRLCDTFGSICICLLKLMILKLYMNLPTIH